MMSLLYREELHCNYLFIIVPYQLKTWATPTSSLRLQYYSDVTDDMYGTLSVGVANTERGMFNP